MRNTDLKLNWVETDHSKLENIKLNLSFLNQPSIHIYSWKRLLLNIIKSINYAYHYYMNSKNRFLSALDWVVLLIPSLFNCKFALENITGPWLLEMTSSQNHLRFVFIIFYIFIYLFLLHIFIIFRISVVSKGSLRIFRDFCQKVFNCVIKNDEIRLIYSIQSGQVWFCQPTKNFLTAFLH